MKGTSLAHQRRKNIEAADEICRKLAKRTNFITRTARFTPTQECLRSSGLANMFYDDLNGTPPPKKRPNIANVFPIVKAGGDECLYMNVVPRLANISEIDRYNLLQVLRSDLNSATWRVVLMGECEGTNLPHPVLIREFIQQTLDPSLYESPLAINYGVTDSQTLYLNNLTQLNLPEWNYSGRTATLHHEIKTMCCIKKQTLFEIQRNIILPMKNWNVYKELRETDGFTTKYYDIKCAYYEIPAKNIDFEGVTSQLRKLAKDLNDLNFYQSAFVVDVSSVRGGEVGGGWPNKVFRYLAKQAAAY